MSDQLETLDPIPEPLKRFVDDIKAKLPMLPDLDLLLRQREGASRLALLLPERVRTEDVADVADSQIGWEWIGRYYMHQKRFHEALAIFNSLYQHMLSGQNAGKRIHKGMPLNWIGDCHSSLDRPVHAKRYRMLTLCEDAIRDQGRIDYQGGPYFRLVWYSGLSHELIDRYYGVCERFRCENPADAMFPERVLSELDQEWMVEVPSTHEMGIYCCSGAYIRYLLTKLGTDSGQSLERLAHYLVGLIPGCRAYLRRRSRSTDYDVVGSLEGPAFDFRSELGRYFVCECKDWSKAADFTALAKFCRVLDSVKSRFGILFSKEGITGAGKSAHAEREQYKVFADRGIVIVVITKGDIERIAAGANFLSILRLKYEEVRLDLQARQKVQSPNQQVSDE